MNDIESPKTFEALARTRSFIKDYCHCSNSRVKDAAIALADRAIQARQGDQPILALFRPGTEDGDLWVTEYRPARGHNALAQLVGCKTISEATSKISRACNAHDDLVRACEVYIERLNDPNGIALATALIRAAVTKAKGIS